MIDFITIENATGLCRECRVFAIPHIRVHDSYSDLDGSYCHQCAANVDAIFPDLMEHFGFKTDYGENWVARTWEVADGVYLIEGEAPSRSGKSGTYEAFLHVPGTDRFDYIFDEQNAITGSDALTWAIDARGATK